MFKAFTISANVENPLRVLQKLCSLLTRKRLKVQRMQVSGNGLSLSLLLDEDQIRWLMGQMGKFVDVFDLQNKIEERI